jgi:hypothetical protein
LQCKIADAFEDDREISIQGMVPRTRQQSSRNTGEASPATTRKIKTTGRALPVVLEVYHKVGVVSQSRQNAGQMRKLYRRNYLSK